MATTRRTTLGPLSQTSLNTRASMGSSLKSTHESKGKGRLSMAAPARNHSLGPNSSRYSTASTSRRSSVYSTRGGSGKRSDPRPIKEKAYQTGCVRTLIAYLSAHGFDQTMTPKSLSGPSTKDFLHILQFLYNQIDPHFQFSPKSPEDEVVMIFQRLRYPVKINKSAVVAPGSPHSWPSMLAALTWIVELLNYEEQKKEQQAEMEALEEMGETLFFEYLSKAYAQFLEGEDDFSELDAELKNVFEEKNGVVREGNEALKEENDALYGEYEELTSGPSPLEEATSNRDDVQADLVKFNKLIQELQEHQDMLEKKLMENSSELERKQVEVEALRETRTALEAQLEAQEIKEEDVLRMTAERNELQERLEEVEGKRAKVDKVTWQQQLQIAQEASELEGIVEAYNGKVSALDLVPESSERANGVAFEATVNVDATKASEVLNVDMKKDIRPALVALKETFAVEQSTAESDLQVSMDQMERIQGDLDDLEADHQRLEGAIKEQEDACQGLKNAMQRMLDRHDKKMGAMEEQMEAMRVAASEEALEASNMRLRETLAAKEKLAVEQEAELAEMRGVMEQVVEQLTAHKQHTMQRLKEVAEGVAAAKKQVEEERRE